MVQSATTDSLGHYSFTTMPGEYSIAVTDGTPIGWKFTTSDVMSLGLISSGSTSAAPSVGLGNGAPTLLESSQTIYEGGLPSTLPSSDPEGSNVTFTHVDGDLPTGVTVNADGTFSGSAEVDGVFNLSLELCDDASPSACATYE